MNILAFVDTHGNNAALNRLIKKADSADLLVCAGDLSNWGNNLDLLIKKFASLNKPLLIIPGNHEHEDDLRKVCAKYPYCVFLHDSSYRINEYVFFGRGGGGFSKTDETFEKISKSFLKNKRRNDKIILVTHAPPSNTKLDYLPWGGHVGCDSYREFIEKNNVVLGISGHLHENESKQDTINGKKIVNPGPDGKIIKI
ncbi:MAG: metallophosphoesterase [Candidatus Nanoarchaeia archaeon]|nr:metallophosphoesterase [Candidatus Nanoarchaeia archaeon]